MTLPEATFDPAALRYTGQVTHKPECFSCTTRTEAVVRVRGFWYCIRHAEEASGVSFDELRELCVYPAKENKMPEPQPDIGTAREEWKAASEATRDLQKQAAKGDALDAAIERMRIRHESSQRDADRFRESLEVLMNVRDEAGR